MYGKESERKSKLNIHGYENGMPMRICPQCGEKKPLSEFGYRKMGNDEIRNQSWCKRCRSKR